MKKTLSILLSCSLLALAKTASADSVTPSYGVFGNLDGATFGGTGIPTDPTAITSIADGDVTVTLGLTAHARYSNPALTNDGAGTFFAQAGANDGNGGPGTAALWNFAFYIDVANASIADYSFKLLYDFNPATGTDESLMGSWDLTETASLLGYRSQYQDSENATFSFLATDGFGGVITAPAFGSFDPNAAGEYSFKLVASPIDGGQFADGSTSHFSAINVQVGTVPDGGSTLVLLGLALAGVGYFRRRHA
jgi:hypothetical protein